jgi:hypothetical protein
MMYSNKMAFAIKVNGKVLKEFKDTVYVPFGSEYSILIKNLHTTRAVVHVFIDGVGQTVNGIVVDAGSECDLERSLLNGSMTAGNKFKFIERTGAVEEHRGIQLEDGLVKIEYQFESATQIRTPVWQTQDHYYNGLKVGTSVNPLNVNGSWLSASGSTNSMNIGTTSATYNVGGVMRGADMSRGEMTGAVASAAINQYCADNGIKSTSGEVHDGAATMDCGFNDAGITVSGSKSEQRFSTAYVGRMDSERFSMVIKLLGETPDNRPVTKSVTVKTKPRCTSCGKQNRATAKFCTECGTALEIFV